MKNITVLYPESEFTPDQLHKLSFTGKVSFADSVSNGSLSGLVKYLREADIVALSPDVFGKNAKKRISEILEKSPKLKGLALNSTHSDFINMDYCQERGIIVTTVPDNTTEAVAEHIVLLLLGCARNIFVNGWEAQKRNYQQELGFELLGKTLGIIGVNAVSERLIKIAKPFGLRIYICNEPPIRLEGAERKSLGQVLCHSDLLVINLPETEGNKKFLDKEKISRIGQGAIVINLSGRSLVDEKIVTEALKSGQINQYVFETEITKPSPLDNVEQAVAFKPISKHTKESIRRSKELWVTNIANMAGVSTS